MRGDRHVTPWGSEDGSIWKLSASQVDGVTGQAVAERWAMIQRQTPYGQTDALAIGPAPDYANAGHWVMGVTQAHGLKDGNLWGTP